jgi:Domain of unknown function (DUF4432)
MKAMYLPIHAFVAFQTCSDMKLYGKEWTRRALEARIGRIEQVGGLRRLQLAEGRETGVEQIQIRTGAGLSYTILPSRGMDIGLAEFGGVPLTWLSPNGEIHPAYFVGQGSDWLRTAVGGLLMTCGLTQVGLPGVDAGEELGLHGRAHHTPARDVCAEGFWKGDEYITLVRGKVEETSMFGWNLRLTRSIQSELGKNQIIIRDIVENTGLTPPRTCSFTTSTLASHCLIRIPKSASRRAQCLRVNQICHLKILGTGSPHRHNAKNMFIITRIYPPTNSVRLQSLFATHNFLLQVNRSQYA